MHPNRKFALAIYAVALARVAHETAGGRNITSERLAESANTHPVVVRRLLGPLRDAGLLTSQPGPGGGWQLSRPASEITLRDIYRALDMEPLFAVPVMPPGVECPLGTGFLTLLMGCFHDAEEAMEATLARVTVADIVASTPAADACCQSHIEAHGEFDLRAFLDTGVPLTRTANSTSPVIREAREG